jgi:hypothetical protein
VQIIALARKIQRATLLARGGAGIVFPACEAVGCITGCLRRSCPRAGVSEILGVSRLVKFTSGSPRIDRRTVSRIALWSRAEGESPRVKPVTLENRPAQSVFHDNGRVIEPQLRAFPRRSRL